MRLLLLLLPLATACPRVVDDGSDAPPTAAAGADVAAFVGQSVSFDGSASSDDSESFAWDFGDGASAEGATASHAFTEAGGYVVTLTVADERGQEANDTLVVTVTDEVPVARIVVTPGTQASAGDTLTFDATTSTSPSLITRAAWRFGDGADAEGDVVTHVYAAAGTFTARLTITDEDGADADAEVAIVIGAPDVSGTYDVVAAPFSCNEYSAAFPDTVLVLAQDGAEVTAQGGNGRVYSGSFDDDGVPLSGTVTFNTGSCGSVSVDVNWRAAPTAPGVLSGRATGFFDLDVPCQCSAVWNVTATRR